MRQRGRAGQRGAETGPAPVSRRYELRWPSFVYIATALFLAVGAVNSQNNLLYWAFGAAVSGVVISGLISGTALMGVRLQREPAPTVSAGGAIVVRYRLSNVHRFMPVFAMVIEEVGLGPRDGAALSLEPAAVAHCPSGESAPAMAAGEAVRRGAVRLQHVRVTSTFPFGLVRKALIFDLPDEVVVLPAVVPVRPRVADVRGRGRFLDSEGAQRFGDGSEFYGVREYVMGDPLSSIAWKRSAAAGTLVVRHTASPLPPRVWVEVDRGVFDAEPRAFEVAMVAAASLVAELSSQGRAVGLSVPAAGLALEPAPGGRAVKRALVALARIGQEGTAASAPRRPGPKDGLIRVVAGGSAGGVDATNPGSWLAAGGELPRCVREPVGGKRRRSWGRGVAA